MATKSGSASLERGRTSQFFNVCIFHPELDRKTTLKIPFSFYAVMGGVCQTRVFIVRDLASRVKSGVAKVLAFMSFFMIYHSMVLKVPIILNAVIFMPYPGLEQFRNPFSSLALASQIPPGMKFNPKADEPQFELEIRRLHEEAFWRCSCRK